MSRRQLNGQIGGVLDIVKAPFEFAGDVASSVAPDWVNEQVAKGADLVGDFAKTPYGFQVLAVLSGGAYMALVPITGPAIVNLTMAAPGMIAGEDFTTAWTKGAIDAVEKLVAVVGALPAGGVAALGLGVKGALAGGKIALGAIAASTGGNIGLDELGKKILFQQAAGIAWADDVDGTLKDPEFQKFTSSVATEAKASGVPVAKLLEDRGITIEKIAQDFGVRPDVAAMAFNAAAHEMIFYPNDFDSLTGQSKSAPIVMPPRPGEGTLGLLEAIYNSVPSPENLKKLEDERARIHAAVERYAQAERRESRRSARRRLYDLFVEERVARGKAQLAVDIAATRARKAKRDEILDAGGVFVQHAAPTAGILGQVLSLALLTAPAWGAWLWIRRRA